MWIPLSVLIVPIILLDTTTADDEANATAATENVKPGFSLFFQTLGSDALNNHKPGFMSFGNQNSNIFKNANPFTSLNNSGFSLPNLGFGLNHSGPFSFASPFQQNKDPGEEPLSDITDQYDDTEDCDLSITTVNMKSVCRKSVVFYEDFSSGIGSKWFVEHFMPTYENNGDDLIFNYFDRQNVVVEKGTLEISPHILANEIVRRGTLNLESCTGTTDQECERAAQYHSILPPVYTGRLNTKNSFSFKYGKVEIVAKVPRGDWLVPEMWLLPKMERYGPGLESGRIAMVMVRGNRVLSINGTDIGNKVLESQLLMASGDKIRSRILRVKNEEPWQSHFNTYVFTWRPDEITVAVNNIVIGRISVNHVTGPLASVTGFNYEEAKKWYRGSNLAPFDEEFYISIGLSVGGRDFPDGSTSHNYAKPWRRKSVKEMADFYRAKDKWEPTWNENLSKFKIQRIKVTAL